MDHYQFYIDGQFGDSAEGATITTIDPILCENSHYQINAEGL